MSLPEAGLPDPLNVAPQEHPGAEALPEATFSLHPWQTAVLGLLCGTLTGAALEYKWDTLAPGLVYGGLAALWSFGLGAAYLGRRWLGLLLLAGTAAFSAWSLVPMTQGYHQIPPLFPTVALALAGMALLRVWGQGNRRPGWQVQAVLPWLVESLVNFLLSGLLGGLFLGLVYLAASLGKAAGFYGLQRALNHSTFSLGLFFVSAAFFVGLLRDKVWARQLTQTLANVLGFLAPVVSVIMLGFLALLLGKAVGGHLGDLYQGMLNSSLYLGLSVAALFLNYCAFQQPSSPLPAALQSLTRLSAFLLPFFSVLALYGLWVRVGQYGLTESRVAGLVLGLALLAATVSMALTAWRPAFRGLWRSVVLLMAALGFLGGALSVPGLRPVELVKTSQLRRLNSALSAQQSGDIIATLAYRTGETGKAALRAVPETQLSAPLPVRSALQP